MSSAFESMKQGLLEAVDFSQGKPVKAVVHEVSPLDVKAVREHVGMTQAEFAAAFGITALERSVIGSAETVHRAARPVCC